MIWPWASRLDALDEMIVTQQKQIYELQQKCEGYEASFEALRIRLSNDEQKPEASDEKDTNWFERRRKLTEQHATKGERDAK